jgi:hypothetical protein
MVAVQQKQKKALSDRKAAVLFNSDKLPDTHRWGCGRAGTASGGVAAGGGVTTGGGVAAYVHHLLLLLHDTVRIRSLIHNIGKN